MSNLVILMTDESLSATIEKIDELGYLIDPKFVLEKISDRELFNALCDYCDISHISSINDVAKILLTKLDKFK